MVKSFLGRIAFLHDKRANTRRDSYEYCAGGAGRDLRFPKAITSREFIFIPVRQGAHLRRLGLVTVNGSKSHFYFIGKSGFEGELRYCERSFPESN